MPACAGMTEKAARGVIPAKAGIQVFVAEEVLGWLGSVDILLRSQMQAQLPPIDIIGQPQQHSLPILRRLRPSRSLSRELPFDCRKDTLHLGPLSILPLREATPHLGTDPMDLPRGFAALGGNNALRSHLMADMLMIAFAVKLSVG